MGKRVKRTTVTLFTGFLLFTTAACGRGGFPEDRNLVVGQEVEEKTVYLFGPMEKSNPDAKNTARSAADLTFIMAEEALDLTVAYRTYTADNYQENMMRWLWTVRESYG